MTAGLRQRPRALLVDRAVHDDPVSAGPVRELLDAAQAAGLPVGLSELDAGDGIRRPARAYFDRACAELATAPAECLYVGVDDRDVRGARAAGLAALRWNGPTDLAYLYAALDLPRG